MTALDAAASWAAMKASTRACSRLCFRKFGIILSNAWALNKRYIYVSTGKYCATCIYNSWCQSNTIHPYNSQNLLVSPNFNASVIRTMKPSLHSHTLTSWILISLSNRFPFFPATSVNKILNKSPAINGRSISTLPWMDWDSFSASSDVGKPKGSFKGTAVYTSDSVPGDADEVSPDASCLFVIVFRQGMAYCLFTNAHVDALEQSCACPAIVLPLRSYAGYAKL